MRKNKDYSHKETNNFTFLKIELFVKAALEHFLHNASKILNIDSWVDECKRQHLKGSRENRFYLAMFLTISFMK